MQVTEEELAEMLSRAWWGGQGASRYYPNLAGMQRGDCSKIISDFKEEKADGTLRKP